MTSFAPEEFAPEEFFGGGAKFVTMNTKNVDFDCIMNAFFDERNNNNNNSNNNNDKIFFFLIIKTINNNKNKIKTIKFFF